MVSVPGSVLPMLYQRSSMSDLKGIASSIAYTLLCGMPLLKMHHRISSSYSPSVNNNDGTV